MTEKHFYSQSADAYWVASPAPSAAIRAGYPADTVETPPRPSQTHVWEAGAWVEGAPVEPDPAALRPRMRMSRRQLLIGLADMGWITEVEAVAAAGTGAVPAAVEAAITALDPEQQLRARITWAAMSEAQRLDPLVALLAAAQGVGDAEVDAFFTTYSSI